MRELRLVTWNVLHRIHAVNWNEAPIAAFPHEPTRIQRITGLVAGWVSSDVSVVCLQEVSGDHLASLRGALGDAQIFDHVYPRVPRLRTAAGAVLDDPSEHLVTIVRGRTSTRLGGKTFDRDPGKGLLAVEVDGICVANTHVTFGERREAQLAILAALARGAHGGAVVLGDFNAPADAVRAALGEPVALSKLSAERPTRIPTPDHPGKVIDHIAVVGGSLESETVLDGGLLSDHNPVRACAVFA